MYHQTLYSEVLDNFALRVLQIAAAREVPYTEVIEGVRERCRAKTLAAVSGVPLTAQQQAAGGQNDTG